jgi:hypothetical protein
MLFGSGALLVTRQTLLHVFIRKIYVLRVRGTKMISITHPVCATLAQTRSIAEGFAIRSVERGGTAMRGADYA